MGLIEVQRTLAHLYTDAELRERFFADPLAVGRELGLRPDEARMLAELEPHEVHSFADSLQAKRFLEIGKLLPMTNRMLGAEFSAFFKDYAGSYSPSGIKKHLGDALAFATTLEREIRKSDKYPGWLVDLLRYEKARLRASDPSCRMVARVFRHDISKLVRSVARREEEPAAHKRLTLAVWWRPQRRGMVRYIVITSPRLPRQQIEGSQHREFSTSHRREACRDGEQRNKADNL